MQATLPKRVGVEGGTFKPYMKGVYFAYAFVCYCYFTVAITGYWAFGQGVVDNVMLSISHPKWVIGFADMFVVIHVFGSYQVCFVATFCCIAALAHQGFLVVATCFSLMFCNVLSVVRCSRHARVSSASEPGLWQNVWQDWLCVSLLSHGFDCAAISSAVRVLTQRSDESRQSSWPSDLFFSPNLHTAIIAMTMHCTCCSSSACLATTLLVL